jgi:hypothetical protein
VRRSGSQLRLVGASPRFVGVGSNPPCGSTDCGLPPGADIAAFSESVDRRRSLEVFSSGIDEAFQSVGSDPFLGTSNFGLRVPYMATPLPTQRYLFNLASYTLADGQQARIRGYRQFWSLGVKLGEGSGPFTIIEQPVEQPGFYLPDGNVSWHMRRLGPGEVPVPNQGPITPPLRSLSFRMSENPSLLYETITPSGSFYVNLTSYTPPNLGRPWGTSLQNNLGTMLDQRTEWRTHGAWHSMDTPVVGPCTIAFFASVLQTNAAAREALPLPTDINGLSDEWSFVINFPFILGESTGALIWRVAGAFIVEVW